MSYITAKCDVCKYTQSRRSRVVNMKQICQRSKAEWSMLCIYIRVLGSQIDGKFQKDAKSSKRTVLNQKVGRSP